MAFHQEPRRAPARRAAAGPLRADAGGSGAGLAVERSNQRGSERHGLLLKGMTLGNGDRVFFAGFFWGKQVFIGLTQGFLTMFIASLVGFHRAWG